MKPCVCGHHEDDHGDDDPLDGTACNKCSCGAFEADNGERDPEAPPEAVFD